MRTILLSLLGAISAGSLLFITIVAGTFFGGVGLWVIGAVFPYIPDTFREVSGLTLTDFEFGALIGFVLGCLKK